MPLRALLMGLLWLPSAHTLLRMRCAHPRESGDVRGTSQAS